MPYCARKGDASESTNEEIFTTESKTVKEVEDLANKLSQEESYQAYRLKCSRLSAHVSAS